MYDCLELTFGADNKGESLTQPSKDISGFKRFMINKIKSLLVMVVLISGNGISYENCYFL